MQLGSILGIRFGSERCSGRSLHPGAEGRVGAAVRPPSTCSSGIPWEKKHVWCGSRRVKAGQGSPSNSRCAHSEPAQPAPPRFCKLRAPAPGPRQQPRRAHAHSATPRPLNILFHVLLVVGATGSPPAPGRSGRLASAHGRCRITGLAGPRPAEEFTRRSRSPPTLTPPI